MFDTLHTHLSTLCFWKPWDLWCLHVPATGDFHQIFRAESFLHPRVLVPNMHLGIDHWGSLHPTRIQRTKNFPHNHLNPTYILHISYIYPTCRASCCCPTTSKHRRRVVSSRSTTCASERSPMASSSWGDLTTSRGRSPRPASRQWKRPCRRSNKTRFRRHVYSV